MKAGDRDEQVRKLGLMAKSSPPPAIVNKVLLDSSVPFFMHYLWLLLCYKSRIE